jgi:hypothetical protein
MKNINLEVDVLQIPLTIATIAAIVRVVINGEEVGFSCPHTRKITHTLRDDSGKEGKRKK